MVIENNLDVTQPPSLTLGGIVIDGSVGDSRTVIGGSVGGVGVLYYVVAGRKTISIVGAVKVKLL